MKTKFLMIAMCLVLGVASASASITGTTNASDFSDTVDWCQFGCTGANLASPQAWFSAGGATGQVGLNGTLQDFYNLQEVPGGIWNGNFPANMGLVYNGAAFGNTPTGIAATFDQGQYGVGAYVQSDFYGPYSATITLFDDSFQVLGTYSANGVAGGPGTPGLLFIGAYSDSANVFAATWDVIDQFGQEDFAMGTMMLPTPEPSTLVLFGTSVMGLAGAIRRRFIA